MTNARTLIFFLALFVVLAAIVFLQENEEAPPPPPTPTITPEFEFQGTLLRVFPELAVLDIQAVRLEDLTTDSQLTLARDDEGQWTAPGLEGELDTSAASSIARTIVLLPYGRSINILNNTEFSDYGFNPAGQMQIQVLKLDGSSHVIAVGGLTDSEASYYTLVDERDEIFEVERGPVDFLRNHILSPPINLTN